MTNGIAAIPGYIQVVYDKPQPRVLKEQQEQYEESVPADEASLDDKSPEQFSFIDQHGARSPSEIVPTKSLNEGAIRSVQVNAYERNSTARAQCIRHYGSKCSVCDFDFERMYGPIGQDFIHVHHIIPIATIGKQYQVDPLRDLIPVCPNCHAMLHRTDPPLTVEELQSYIRR